MSGVTRLKYYPDPTWSIPGAPFTGDVTKYAVAACNGEARTFTTSAFPSITSLRVYGWRLASTSDSDGFFVNGTDYTALIPTSASGGATADWATIPVTKLETLTWNTTSGAAEHPAISAIEVDGELLVDGGSFGANGFHLPFDPAATGANYSETIFTNNTAISINGHDVSDQCFDGNLSFGLGIYKLLMVSLPNANYAD